MTNPHLLDELTQRGLVAQNSDPVALADHLATRAPSIAASIPPLAVCTSATWCHC